MESTPLGSVQEVLVRIAREAHVANGDCFDALAKAFTHLAEEEELALSEVEEAEEGEGGT